MDSTLYTKIWDVALPAMLPPMRKIVSALREHLPAGYTVCDPIVDDTGDEYMVVINVSRGKVVALGCDFTLVDAGLREDEDGVGISMPVVGYGGLVLGGFQPLNWTDSVWTVDPEEVLTRIEGLDVESFVSFLLKDCLANPSLIAELAGTDGTPA